MIVELGNVAPTRVDNSPVVTTCVIPDGAYTYEVADSAADLARSVAVEIATAPDGITRLPGQEALLAVIHSWRAESTAPPSWVWSDNADFAVLLGAYFDCPVGRPDDVEATHFTHSGAPGTGPVNSDPNAEPAPPVLEGADAEKVQPPAEEAGNPEVTP